MNNPVARFKYPRTYHLPYSECLSDDDKRLSSDDYFKAMHEVVVTAKMDGENTTVYPDGYIHARSIDGAHNPWQDWLKKYSSKWYWKIPEGFRVCGENLYARHSISYHFKDESEYFQVFGVYEGDLCLGWEETIRFIFDAIECSHVPIIYIGKYDKEQIMAAFNEYRSNQKDEVEGFVVRNYDPFRLNYFSRNVGKYVRKNHITTDEHWTKSWTKNEIIS